MGETEPRPGRDHFTDEDWLDYARDLAVSRDALERHLAGGCNRCEPTLRFWRSVLTLARAEAAYAPPLHAVRQARASFAAARPAPRPSLAALVFDSFRQPLPAGVRAGAGAPSARQMMFKAGPYAVRLRVERAGDSDRVSVVGQVVDDADPTRALADLSVLALRGTQAVDRTLTNRLGEFQLEPESADNLRLSVGVPDRGPLTVPLPVHTRARGAVARVLGGTGRKTQARRDSGAPKPGRQRRER